MKLSKQYAWLSADDFARANPQQAKIIEVQHEQTENGPDTRLVVHLIALNKTRRMSVFGDNLNKLIDAFTDEDDLWKGHVLNISRLTTPEGKNRIEFSNLQTTL